MSSELNKASNSFTNRDSNTKLLKFSENTISEDLLNTFFKPVWGYLMSNLNQNVFQKLSLELNFKYYLLIVFLGLLVLGFLVLWLPLQYSLNEEISRTKNMLDIIPRSIIKEINSII